MGQGGRSEGSAPQTLSPSTYEPQKPQCGQAEKASPLCADEGRMLLVQHGPKLLMVKHSAATVLELKLKLAEVCSVPPEQQRLVFGSKDLDREDAQLQEIGLGDYASLHLMVRCLGGKGGFGAMLRGQASRPGMKKVESNTGAMRDLSGRRLRHVEQEHKLAEWQAEGDKRRIEKEEAKKAKRQKTNEKVHEAAEKYLAEAVVSTDHVEDAVKDGLLEEKKKKEREAAEEAVKRQEAVQKAKKLDKMWGMGDDDSDDEDEEPQPSKTSAPNPSTQPAVPSKPTPSAPEPTKPSEPATVTATANPPAPAASNATSLKLPAPKATAENGVNGSTAPVPPEKLEDIKIEAVKDLAELEAMGADRLKFALQQRGLKCGGTPQQRAERLLSIKGLSKDKWPQNLFAAPAKK